VENVAAAIALAATDNRAAGRIYNIVEQPAFSELEWARKIAAEMKWNGEFLVLPPERAPRHLVPSGNTAQHWEVDSSRIRGELGYREPVSIKEGIRRTIDWERANPPGAAASLHPPLDYDAEDAALLRTGGS